MNTKTVWRGLAVVWALMQGVPGLLAADVREFNLLKGQIFMQTGTGAPVPAGATSFVMQCMGNATQAGALTNMTFTEPNSVVNTVSPDGDTGFRFEQAFSSQSALNAQFADGTYTVTMKTVNDGTRSVALNLAGDLYPDTPHVSNFTAAQAVDPEQDFTLTWDTWVGGTANDVLFVSVRDSAGHTVFSSAEQAGGGGLSGASTSHVIPRRTLRPGQTYSAELLFGRGSDMNSTTYPGANGLAAYFKSLRFNLVTTGTQTGPVSGQFQLVFSFNHGNFAGTVGSINFPQPLSYYFALYNIDNDVNYPSSVTFNGPGTSGLTNVASLVNGSSFGTSAFYSSPSVFFSPNNLPPGAIYAPNQPPGGVYSVGYKTSTYLFNMLDPLSGSQQILLVPTVVLSGTDTIQEIRWTYKNSAGTTVPPQAFMNNIEIRVNGTTGGRLYDGGNNGNVIPPTTTNHFPSTQVAWANVSSIQMLFVDTVGNQYVSYWDRAAQPVEITTTGLPTAVQGTPYSFLLGSQGGNQPVTWSLLSGFLPSGLNLNAGTGEILGTPGENGSFPFTVQATDRSSAVTNRALTLNVTPGTFSAPIFTNALRDGTGQLRVHAHTVSNQTYTLEVSTNFLAWRPLRTLLATSNLTELIDPESLRRLPRQFYRLRIGRVFASEFNFHHFAIPGTFTAGLTPGANFPVTLSSYTANFDTLNSATNPPANSVLFTGPGGSGVTASPAVRVNSDFSEGDTHYESGNFSGPAIPPGGTWTVNYHGTNHTFTVPDPQSASRLVVPFPTITLSGANLTGVSWVYRDATTGATLPQPPAYMTDIQVQVDDLTLGRVYNSAELSPSTTSVSGITSVNWNTVDALYLAYNDTLGNHYVIIFPKP